MKFNRISLVAALFVAAGVFEMHAAARIWQNTGTDMNTAGSWNAALNVAGGDVAKFTAAPVTQPDLSASLSIAGVSFNTTAASGYTLTNTGGAALTLTGYSTTGTSGAANSSAAAIRSDHTSGTNTISAPLVLAPASTGISTFVQNGTGTLLVSGNISGTANLSFRGVTGSTIELSGTNTYVGDTGWYIPTATMVLSSNSALSSGILTITNALTLTANGTRDISNNIVMGQSSTIADGGNLTLSGNVTNSGSSRTIQVNSGNLTTFSGNVIISESDVSRTLNITGSGNVTISGNIINNIAGNTTASSLTFNSTGGTLTLSGVGSHSGNTTFNGTGSQLVLASDTALGASTLFINSSGAMTASGTRNIPNNVLLHGAVTTIGDGGSLTLSGNVTNNNGSRNLTVANAAGTTLSGNVFLSESNTARTLTINGTQPVTISGNIANNSGDNTPASNLTYSGSSTLTLSGINTHTGTTTVSNGTLKMGASGSVAPASSLTVNNVGAIFDLNGRSIGVASLTGNADGVITNGAASTTPTLTIGNNDGNGTFSGTIQDGSGVVALIKTGNATITLAGNNTYNGGTTVSSGKLWINGNLANSTVTVSGGTLGGTGTIGGAVTLTGGTLAPGNSAGTLTISGAIAASTASILDFEIGSTVASYDVLKAGSLDATNLTLNLTNPSAVLLNSAASFNIFQTVGAAPLSVTGTFTAVNLPTPESGFVWDQSALYSSGTLSLVASSGVLPAITTQPSTQTVAAGTGVTFTVVATGTPTPTYQWKKNTVDISGATDASYNIAVAQLADAGSYTVDVTNTVGTVTSDAAVLTVTPNFYSWQQSKFTAPELADPLISGPEAVYGADGIPNLVKYALGLEPAQNVVVGLPVLTKDGTDWIYTYTRPSSITDLTYAVEFSTTLASWSSVGVTHSMVSDVSGVQTWTGLYPRAGTPKIIMRLRVTQ